MQFGRHVLDLSIPRIMGVLNVTPDSFYDGGQLYSNNKLVLSQTLKRAEEMVSQGADFIDIGGESTRPGAEPVSIQEEIDRVLPVLEALGQTCPAILSIDTSSPELMIEASKYGAGLINDVRALERSGALHAAAQTALPVCLMHMRGSPQTMQQNPEYQCVKQGVRTYFEKRINACVDAGIKRERLLLDPGIGFGKTDEHNLELIRDLKYFSHHSLPVLMGVSRKSLIGRLLGRMPEERLAGSLGFAYASLLGGATILRVHDVAQTKDIVEIFKLIHIVKSS